MPRLFIALPIRDEIRDELKPVHDYLGNYRHLLKLVPPENYHITVKFLGECSGTVANAIESTFYEINAPSVEIPYTINGLGTFPDIKKPRVLWAGLETDIGEIEALFKNVELFTRNFSFKEETRDFQPHLTLARVRTGRRITGDLLKYIENYSDQTFGSSVFERLSLYSSKMTSDGPVYTELKSIRF